MFRNVTSFGAAVAALATMAVATPSARADDTADFYRGKTVTILVGFGSGGTYGKYSRMIAQFMRNHIPGKPQIKIRHMPGGGGVKATNYAYNQLPKDGTALLMPPDTLLITEILRPNKVKFRSRNFTWLGSVTQTDSVLVLRADTGVRTVADMRNTPITMASSGKGSPTFLIPAMLNGVFGTKIKIVEGYKGSRKMMRAMEQGQAHGLSVTWSSWRSAKPHWFRDGYARPILQVAVKKHPDLPNVPLASEMVRDPEDLKIVKLISSFGVLGRGLVAPPGVPATRIAALRTAFDNTVKDPNYLSQAKRRKLDIKAATGKQVQRIVNETMNVSPTLVRRARAAIFGGAQ